jgi:single-stranded-DNA-specific exonuclease
MPEGGLPDAVANLDPKRPDCPYPFKELSGCGIAFKLAQAFVFQENKPVESIDHLLDLVAVSTACDIVPMIGENRILTHHGLYRLNHAPRTGIWALINKINRPFPLAVGDLVFGLGPMINAAGRLGDARDAVRLMLATDRNSALDEAGMLSAGNRARREVDSEMAGEARRLFEAIPDWQERKSIVLFSPEWHKGVIGIAASRMTEWYHRPSVILTLSNGRAVGSARSVRGFDLYAAFQQCEDLFFSFGGHAFAAGMQMPVEQVPAFTERFETLVRTNLSREEETPLVEISARISLDDITPKLWNALKRFEPFGPHNRNPTFLATRVRDSGRSRQLDNNHVRLSLRQEDGKGAIGGIGFGLGTAFEAVKDQAFDIVFNIREEHWRGQKILSLQVKDLRPTDGIMS